MLKNMKLATKIAVGFGGLIVISIAVGCIAIWNMKNVEGQSVMLANEYVPEVRAAAGVQENLLLTMYNIRGYGLNESDEYLKLGREHLAEMKKQLEASQELANRSEHLEKLKEAVPKAQAKVREYEQIVERTVATNQAIAGNRSQMNESAARYMENSTAFLQSQNEAMTKEIEAATEPEKLKERLQKITWVSDLVNLGNTVRLAAWRAQAQRDPKVIENAMPTFDELDKRLDSLRAVTRQEVNLKQIEEIKAAAGSYKKAMNDLVANWVVLQDIAKQRTVIGSEVRDQVKAIADTGLEQTDGIAKGAATALSTASSVLIGGLAVAVIVGVILAMFISRSITLPFKEIFKGLKTFSAAELQQTAVAFKRIINGMTDSVSQVNDAAAQVSSASQSLAEGASEQASSLEETSSALEQMAAMTRTNAENARQANELSAEAARAAEEGNSTMTSINTSSDQISKIIKVIEEIAFQTNLLALNAAVEAARAGEHGKGFAVVADEVRNLAQRAAQAAQETTSLISNSVAKSREGTTAIQAIVSGVNKVTELINGIARASQEQAQGVDQVNTAVSQMDKVTQQNASGAEESASAAEELAAQAAATQAMVNELVVLVEGDTGRGTTGTGGPHAALGTGANRKHFNIKKANLHPKSGGQHAAGGSRTAGDATQADEFLPVGNTDDVKDF
ncbi:MAG TPA: methyl-accepting chemotaxis protein [Phycisphaerae bacterium]|nr:methyl-accepting chemotaxis protein [Phycisphaerae bacterium]HNU45440.1 methyl-accepting chemotaxis protein [Phycisphaerae bacterium]